MLIEIFKSLQPVAIRRDRVSHPVGKGAAGALSLFAAASAFFASAALAIPPDRQAPTVTIASPANGTTYTSAQTVTIAANASDNVGVSRVEFYDNGVLRGTDTLAPFSMSWTISSSVNGAHGWTARAYDVRGNSTTSSSVTLNVSIAAAADTTRPTVSLTSPASGSTFTTAQTVTVFAAASDNVGVTRIEFYDGATLKCSGTGSSCAWPITSANNGSHAWTAKAYDAAGNTATSATTTLNVNIGTVAGDTTPPSVSITGPASGTVFTTATTVSINASASDNVAVSRIEFYDGGTLKCSGTGLSCAWSIASSLNGAHSWTARAYDAAGNSTTSAPVSLTVNIAATTSAGAPLWVDAFGGATAGDIATGKATAIDPTGNVFVAATLAGSGDFNPAAPLYSSNTNGNIVLAKYASGGGIQWTRMWAGSATTAIPTSMQTDGSGAVFVTGYYQGAIDFGGGSLTSTGGYNMFVVKYGGDGSFMWARRFGGTGSIAGNALSLDGVGGLYVAGYLQGGGDFGGGALTSNAGSRDAFVAKYNAADGGYQWARVYGGAGTDTATGVDVGPDGQPVITGSFQQSASFGGSTFTSAGSDDVFVAKLTSAGAGVWSQRYGGAGSDQPAGLGIDGTGAIVIAVRYTGSANFGGLTLSSVGDYDIALAKYSAAGTPVWSNSLGGLYTDLVQAIAVNANGDIAITGTTLSAIDFGGGYLFDNGSYDIFVAKYAASGAHVWSKRAGKLYDDRGTGVAIDGTGAIAATGFFVQGINFGNGDILNSGGADGYIAKFAP